MLHNCRTNTTASCDMKKPSSIAKRLITTSRFASQNGCFTLSMQRQDWRRFFQETPQMDSRRVASAFLLPWKDGKSFAPAAQCPWLGEAFYTFYCSLSCVTSNHAATVCLAFGRWRLLISTNIVSAGIFGFLTGTQIAEVFFWFGFIAYLLYASHSKEKTRGSMSNYIFPRISRIHTWYDRLMQWKHIVDPLH